MAVSLNRMAVDDVAREPARIVDEIHRQLGEIPPPIPVHEIARALDIVDIHEQPLRNFEAALVTTGERNLGSVLLNRSSSPQRRRYSLGHELGHFLCDWHRPMEGESFQCTQFDMTEPKGGELHIRQENEANLFAIELLAPKRFFLRYLRRVPDLEHVLALHSTLEISKAAAVRRYVALHPERLSVVFARNGAFEYVVKGGGFPWVEFRKGDRLPDLPLVGPDAQTSEMVEADARDWIRSTDTAELAVQLLPQENDYSIILLHLAGGAGDDDDDR